MLSHDLLEKESNVSVVVPWVVVYHACVENGLLRPTLGAGRPHGRPTSLEIFFFPMGRIKCTFVCYGDEMKL